MNVRSYYALQARIAAWMLRPAENQTTFMASGLTAAAASPQGGSR